MSWITGPDLGAFLKSSNVDDPELADFADAACSAIELVKGHVDTVPNTTSVVVVDRRGTTLLPETPVASVQTVTRLLGGGATVVVDKADPVAGVEGWTLTSTGGVLTVPGCGWQLSVVYTPGLDPIPTNIVQAAKELGAHMWRRAKFNSAGGRGAFEDEPEVVPGLANTYPYAVRELLGLSGRVLRDEVFIA